MINFLVTIYFLVWGITFISLFLPLISVALYIIGNTNKNYDKQQHYFKRAKQCMLVFFGILFVGGGSGIILMNIIANNGGL